MVMSCHRISRRLSVPVRLTWPAVLFQPDAAAVGVGSVVAVDYGSVRPVPVPQAAPVTFQLHVKSSGIKVSGPSPARRPQDYRAGLLTVRDLVLSGNEIANRRRQLRVDDQPAAGTPPQQPETPPQQPETPPQQPETPPQQPEKPMEDNETPSEDHKTSPGVREPPSQHPQMTAEDGETAAPAQDDDVPSQVTGDGSGEAPDAADPELVAADDDPVLMTGAFAGFSGQVIPILADSEDERRIEDALAAAQEEDVEGSGLSGQPRPEVTVTNIMKAVLSQLESRQQAVLRPGGGPADPAAAGSRDRPAPQQTMMTPEDGGPAHGGAEADPLQRSLKSTRLVRWI